MILLSLYRVFGLFMAFVWKSVLFIWVLHPPLYCHFHLHEMPFSISSLWVLCPGVGHWFLKELGFGFIEPLLYFCFLFYYFLLTFFFKDLFTCIYLRLYWVLIALHRPSPLVVSGGYSLVAVHGLLIPLVSLVVDHGL